MSLVVHRAASAPDWERSCWIVALEKTLRVPEKRITDVARSFGWDGVTFGLSVADTIHIAVAITGKPFDLSATKAAKGMTARQYSGTTKLTGLVFVKGHVMPMVKGALSNFNGYGDDEVLVVAIF
jgi:hypothetical protein